MSNKSEVNNLALWDRVEKTDPAHTKVSNQGGRTVTSINGAYLVKMATKEFGQIGDGWGYDIVSDRYDEGAPAYNEKGELIGHAIMHTILLELWYMKGGEKKKVSQFGHTPYVQKTKYGMNTDFDAPKKSLTDAMKKSLSLLGFSADIFLGMFDDKDYVDQVSNEKSIESAINKEEEADKQTQAYVSEMKSYVDAMQTSKAIHELNAIYKKALRVATYKGDEKGQLRLTQLREELLAGLKENKDDSTVSTNG